MSSGVTESTPTLNSSSTSSSSSISTFSPIGTNGTVLVTSKRPEYTTLPYSSTPGSSESIGTTGLNDSSLSTSVGTTSGIHVTTMTSKTSDVTTMVSVNTTVSVTSSTTNGVGTTITSNVTNTNTVVTSISTDASKSSEVTGGVSITTAGPTNSFSTELVVTNNTEESSSTSAFPTKSTIVSELPVITTKSPSSTSSVAITESTSRSTDISTNATSTTEIGSSSQSTSSLFETTVSTEMNSTLSTTTEATVPLFVCPGVGIFPDTVNCSVYHVCMNAYSHLLDVPITCPQGTQFDSERSKCTRDPVQCPGELPLPCNSPGTYPHPSDCSRYYKCIWRSLFLKYELKQYRCPPSYKFDYKEKKCSKSVLAKCFGNSTLPPTNSTEVPFTCVEEGCFPVEDNCVDYYVCKMHNNKLELKMKHCGCGKLFDRERRRCVKSFMAHCPIDDYDDSGEDENDSDYSG
ncbi:hypothetical protein ILUMI_08533 [Ignelater luminosus]|uniref:Chitin-binding type-2 domain-containing protein n=1 Tax=Ignelater luminosus TaxID=2038154 RepID=A0A8K0GGX9_IGNLU|nr:hypothetical protein ILUMI_08533 [Ignelater luminosus]